MVLRVSDLLRLTWHELLDEDTFIIHEKKTGKRRIIKVNDTFKRSIIQPCYEKFRIGLPGQVQALNQAFLHT